MFSSVFKMDCVALVLSLLPKGCPNAIAGFVISVVIQALQAVSGWTEAHIFEEVGEAVAPTVTDLDATTTIIVPSWAVLPKATCFGVDPFAVGIAGLRMTRVTVRSEPLRHGVFHVAAATFTATVTQGFTFDNALSPAVTAAMPVGGA